MERLSFRSGTDAAGFTILSNLVLLDTSLSDGAKVTYLVLLHHARQAGSCFPGQERLSQERGVTERSVRSHLKELTERTLITVERRGRSRTNLYWLEPLEEVYGKKSSEIANERKISSGAERQDSSAPLERLKEESLKRDSETLNVRKRSDVNKYVPDIERLISLTGDTKSTRRFAQLYDIALRNGCASLWDEAVSSLKKRLGRIDEPLRNPGAYFCSTVSSLLCERGVYVPVGSKEEREKIRGTIQESLDSAAGK